MVCGLELLEVGAVVAQAIAAIASPALVYAAKRLQKQGTALQVIMQIGGWKREAMPTRYIGKYDESELKSFPTADLRSLLRGA
jgi:hypothetical protein